MMKYICLVVLTILVTKSQADIDADIRKFQDKFKLVIDKCVAANGPTESDATILQTGKLDAKSGCFIFCVAKEFEVVKPDNTFDKDKINKILEPMFKKVEQDKNEQEKVGPVRNAINSCLDKQTAAADGCTSGKNLGECVISGLKKANILPQ